MINIKGKLSLTTAFIQNKVNDLYKLETSDIYGTLFEFIDRKIPTQGQEDIVDTKVKKIRTRIHSETKKIQENLGIIPTRKRINTSDLRALNEIDQRNFADTFNKQTGPVSSYSKKATIIQFKERSNSASRSVLNRSRPGTAKTGSDLKDGRKVLNTGDDDDDDDDNPSRPMTEQTKKVQFSTTPPPGKRTPQIQSRVAKYIRGNNKRDDNSNLLGMYHYERQKKASEKLKQELELFEKLAYRKNMKGGQHLLRAEKQIDAEEKDKHEAQENSYNKSFMRLKEGLRILREKNHTTQYFDQEGNYVNYTKQTESKEDEKGLELSVNETSLFSESHHSDETLGDKTDQLSSASSVPEYLQEFRDKPIRETKSKTQVTGSNVELKRRNAENTHNNKSRGMRLLLLDRQKAKWMESHKQKEPVKVQTKAVSENEKPLDSSIMIRRIIGSNVIKQPRRFNQNIAKTLLKGAVPTRINIRERNPNLSGLAIDSKTKETHPTQSSRETEDEPNLQTNTDTSKQRITKTKKSNFVTFNE